MSAPRAPLASTPTSVSTSISTSGSASAPEPTHSQPATHHAAPHSRAGAAPPTHHRVTPQLPSPVSPLKPLQGLALLLLMQSMGEALSHFLHLPIPGPVVGMVLLLFALSFRPVQRAVAPAASFLLTHLSLLFVPVGVGVMTHLDMLGAYGLRLLVVIVFSTWAGMAATVWALRAFTRDGTTAKKQTNENAAP